MQKCFTALKKDLSFKHERVKDDNLCHIFNATHKEGNADINLELTFPSDAVSKIFLSDLSKLFERETFRQTRHVNSIQVSEEQQFAKLNCDFQIRRPSSNESSCNTRTLLTKLLTSFTALFTICPQFDHQPSAQKRHNC